MPQQTGFEAFWQAWPRNSATYTRKGAKSECLKRWLARYHETQAAQIIAHVNWLKGTADWLKDGGAFIPAPLVYLNQQRWDGAEIPAPQAENTAQSWIREQDAHVRTPPPPEVLALRSKPRV